MKAGCCAKAASSVLPGAALVLLPKCPLCLAAWLTVVTGVAVPAAPAAYLRGTPGTLVCRRALVAPPPPPPNYGCSPKFTFPVAMSKGEELCSCVTSHSPFTFRNPTVDRHHISILVPCLVVPFT